MINVSTSDAPKSVAPYPKIMVSKDTGVLVLFSEKGIGTCLTTASVHELGKYSEDWYMSSFSDFNDAVTLSNA